MKAADLSVLLAPTIEVRADALVHEGKTLWSLGMALPVYNVVPTLAVWRCPSHQRLYDQVCERQFGISGPLFKVVDIFRDSGQHQRLVFRANGSTEETGGSVSWTLRRDDESMQSISRGRWLDARLAIDNLINDTLVADRLAGSIVIVPPEWETYRNLGAFSPVYLYDTEVRAAPYVWSPHAGIWVPIRSIAARRIVSRSAVGIA